MVEKTSSGSIVFLGINSSFSHSLPGLRILAELARRTGWDVHLFEATIKDDIHKVLEKIESYNPRIIATTFYLFNRNYLEKFLAEYKSKHPGCMIIGGGPEFLGDNAKFLGTARYIDMAVRGEGERAFVAFLDLVDKPTAWNSIPGLCFYRSGQYIDGGNAEPVKDLSEIPFPYDNFPLDPKKPFAHIETSRGCANSCIFCVSANTQPVRYLKEELVLSRVSKMVEAGVRSFKLLDRTFNDKPSRAVSLVRRFREKFPNIRFHLEIDPVRLTPSLLEELSKATPGTLHLEVGVQSLKAETLIAINRASTPKTSLNGLKKICSLKNIEVHADLIAGLPEADYESVVSDLVELVKIAPDKIQLELLKVLPGTALCKKSGEFGIKYEQDPPYTVTETRWMSNEDLGKAELLSLIVDRFYNVDCFKEIVVACSETIENFWFRLIDNFETRLACREATEQLEQRFKILATLSAKHESIIWKLQYAWMKKGLSARSGFCETSPSHESIPPAGMTLLEGDQNIIPARSYLLDAGIKYLFVYARNSKNREAGAIYTESKGPG
ncbi:MAG: B12-binding domain-containing radical SAM protein [Lentisphaerae bacterium]|nr:B12-binding domain-containing radical SAM protein [Lentisphaerota bacterium]